MCRRTAQLEYNAYQPKFFYDKLKLPMIDELLCRRFDGCALHQFLPHSKITCRIPLQYLYMGIIIIIINITFCFCSGSPSARAKTSGSG